LPITQYLFSTAALGEVLRAIAVPELELAITRRTRSEQRCSAAPRVPDGASFCAVFGA